MITTVAFKFVRIPTFFGLEGMCAWQTLDWLKEGLGIAREEVVCLSGEDHKYG